MRILDPFNESSHRPPWRERLRHLLYDTPAEIVVGAAFLGAVAGVFGYRHEIAKEDRLPIAFSEILKTEREATYNNTKIPSETLFFAHTNDACARIFESHNIAQKIRRNDHRVLAQELETRIDPNQKVYRLLSDDVRDIPIWAVDVLRLLDTIDRASKDLRFVTSELNQAWDSDHWEVEKEVCENVKVCDSENENCRTEEQCHDECDYEVYTYTYYPRFGVNSARLLAEFLQKFPNLNIPEEFALATRTGAEGEYAAETSRVEEFDGKRISQEQALESANLWATSSKLAVYEPRIIGSHNTLRDLSPKWNDLSRRSHSVRQEVACGFSGTPPAGYKINRQALEHAVGIREMGREIVEGVHFAAQQIPHLEGLVRKYIGVALDGKPGDRDKLRTEIIDTAKGVYRANFTGLDVDRFKWPMVLLWALAGALAGGAIGWGVDRAIGNGQHTLRRHRS